MFEFLRSLGFGRPLAAPAPTRLLDDDDSPPSYVELGDGSLFRLGPHLTSVNGLPYVDWKPVEARIAAFREEQQRAAWAACAKAWLLRLKAALGTRYQLTETKQALLLSSLEAELARVTCEFMQRMSSRIVRLLDGIAAVPGKGEIVLVMLDDGETYYRYVSYFYPDSGEFALSGGMYLGSGCGHFVTVKAEQRVIERVIVHEMTHASLVHLALPAWLNEGLAVNTEQALSMPRREPYTPEQLHAKHQRFWVPANIQEFWSGRSFERTDEGNMLSYDLAQIIVEQMAKDWASFRAFVLAAKRADGGQASARANLDTDLGAYVCALLEKDAGSDWEPNRAAWLA